MNSSKQLLTYLANDSFLILNKKLVQLFGPEMAVLLSNFIDKFKYFNERDQDCNGWFYLTEQQQSASTGMSLHLIRKNRKELEKAGILWTRRQGQPARMFYKINHQTILSILNADIENIDVEGVNNQSLKALITRHQKRIGLSYNNNTKLNETKSKKLKAKKLLPESASPTSETSIQNGTSENLHSKAIAEKPAPQDDNKNDPPRRRPAKPSNEKKRRLTKRAERQFEKFWEIWPRKKNKKKAKEIWIRLFLKGDLPKLKIILNAVNGALPEWNRGPSKYIPHATTWLNAERWDDEVDPIVESKLRVGDQVNANDAADMRDNFEKKKTVINNEGD